ncbi:MAG: polysaccharide deacetylase family protein [Kofleriaceae bacterium]|nr:polysaccharide deacetylase family protein [Kofleriaceae bacterium]
MRWSALLVVVLALATAEAHTHAVRRTKQVVKKRSVAVAITKPAPADPLVKPETKPEPPVNQFTNDPVVGSAERVVGKHAPGIVAFTFDDGPVPATTPAVLDALKKYDIPATFFIVTKHFKGKDKDKARELLARELAEGHMVGSHTIGHVRLREVTPKELTQQLDGSFKELSTEAKIPIGLFRAPYGKIGPAARKRLKMLGVTEVYWSIDTRDWEITHGETLRKSAIKQIVKQNGGVVLMHDAKEVTAKVISEVLDDLEAENCKRLAAKQEPIWPVTLHYFLRDGELPRAVPAEVAKKLDTYKAALPGRCAAREAAAKPAAAVPAAK